jgi:serine/tyrosine/threonine adenylyltransferase
VLVPRFGQRFAALPALFHTPVTPRALPGARLVAVSAPAAALLGLDADTLAAPEHLAWMSGATLPPGTQPLASAYAGHQFGVYVPQLGDGRVVLLGDLPGRDGQRYEVQLKGVGPTPFARGADGRVGLSAALRELAIAEALAGLRIPAARVVAVLAGELRVTREEVEPAAVVVRLAPTHLRFGHFEYAHWRGEATALRALADHVIVHHVPHAARAPDPYRALLEHIVLATARTVALWQAYGFAHGVLNTDNMGVLGDTLDIGPTCFLETFAPARAHNASDTAGRYTLARQAAVVGWNLRALGRAFEPLVPAADQPGPMALYEAELLARYGEAMRARLGLVRARPEDAALVDDLLALLARAQVDYPAFLRALADYDPAQPASGAPLVALVGDADRAALDAWLARYARRLHAEAVSPAVRHIARGAANPRYVPREAALGDAIAAAARGEHAPVRALLAALAAPYVPRTGMQDLAAPLPPGAAGPVLSCLT